MDTLCHVQKKISEYPLPATVQTHEVAAIGEDLLLITQQERNGLIKVALDPTNGNPIAASKFTLGNSMYQGAHGLCASKAYPGYAWVTLQFDNSIILVDPRGKCQYMPPVEVKKFPLQKPLRGPHVVIEAGDYLWVTCKDSSHVAKVNHKTGKQESYVCSRKPIFVAMTSYYVYATLFETNRIFCLDLESSSTSEIEIPAAKYGSVPVGLLTGPDGNAWFTLLGGPSGGTGTFGRIIGKEITWYQLNTAKNAGLLHLAFDNEAYIKSSTGDIDIVVWLLGSSVGSLLNLDAVFTVHLQGGDPSDPNYLRLAKEDAIVLPTQSSKAHRILKHSMGLFVTELGASLLAHITGTATKGPDDDDQAADAYALWGLGALCNHIEYVPSKLLNGEEHGEHASAKRKKISI